MSRELKRNSSSSGNYLWFKEHAKAMERRKRTAINARLDESLVWRIKEMIVNNQWSPRQISGVLSKEGIKVSCFRHALPKLPNHKEINIILSGIYKIA